MRTRFLSGSIRKDELIPPFQSPIPSAATLEILIIYGKILDQFAGSILIFNINAAISPTTFVGELQSQLLNPTT